MKKGMAISGGIVNADVGEGIRNVEAHVFHGHLPRVFVGEEAPTTGSLPGGVTVGIKVT